MIKAAPSIVVVGSIIYDFRISADRLPRPGETVTGYGFGTSTGGKGANQAIAAVRLGAAVHLLGRVGADTYGDRVLEQFDQDGLKREYVLRDGSAPTATCLIHVDKHGENDIIISEGANANVSRADVEAARPILEKADVLLLQNEVPLLVSQYAIEIAGAAGATIIYNPAPAQLLPDETMSRIDFFTPNETEAQFYTGISIEGDRMRAGQAAGILLGKGVRHVIITLGECGCLYASQTERKLFPAFPITPVDSTAAGDAFNGGLAVMIGESRPIHEAIRFANAAGAVCAMRPGAQTAIGSRREVDELIGAMGSDDHLYGIALADHPHGVP